MDTTFNGTGYVTKIGTAGGTGGDVAFGVAVDSLGRIVAVGSSLDATPHYNLVVWRYNDNGSLDTANFGSPNGFVTKLGTAGGVLDQGNAVAIDGSGRIVVAGQSSTGTGTALAIWRYLTSGTLDTLNFGNPNGFVFKIGTAGGAADYGRAVAIDGSGKIVVSGESWDGGAPTRPQMATWRYTAAGTLDTTGFNSTLGYVLKTASAGASSNQRDTAYGMALDGSGNVIITGSSFNGTANYDMALWRYTSAGAADTANFNNPTGYVVKIGTLASDLYEWGNAAAVDSLGRVLTTGYVLDASAKYHLGIWRYTSAGVLDTTGFAAPNGFVTKIGSAGGTSDYATAMALDSQGRIVVVGYSADVSGNPQLAVWRYHADGTPDATFNSPNGFVTPIRAAGGIYDLGNAVTFDSQGRIVVAGRSDDGTGKQNMAIWRFWP